MEETFSKVEELAGHVKEYIDNRVSSAKLSIAEKSSTIIANGIAVALTLLVFTLFIIFISLAAAFLFARITGEYYWGFLIVGGLYFLLGILIWVLKEKLLRYPIMNAFLKQFFQDEVEETNDEN